MPVSDDPVNAVHRALRLLEAFETQSANPTLALLCRRTGLPKTSALRLLRTLRDAGYTVQTADGRWRLGPAAARLAPVYPRGLDPQGTLAPTLAALAGMTGRPACFFAHEGDVRVLLGKVEIVDGDIGIGMGEPRPLERGAAGKVILAFGGRQGALFDDIRRRGFHAALGEVNRHVASIAAPVFGQGGTVLGSMTLSSPSTASELAGLRAVAPAVVAAARRLSGELTRGRHGGLAPPVRAAWHPGAVA